MFTHPGLEQEFRALAAGWSHTGELGLTGLMHEVSSPFSVHSGEAPPPRPGAALFPLHRDGHASVH